MKYEALFNIEKTRHTLGTVSKDCLSELCPSETFHVAQPAQCSRGMRYSLFWLLSWTLFYPVWKISARTILLWISLFQAKIIMYYKTKLKQALLRLIASLINSRMCKQTRDRIWTLLGAVIVLPSNVYFNAGKLIGVIYPRVYLAK